MAVSEYLENQEEVSLRQVATKWEVPHMTLQNHVKNRNLGPIGRPCWLSPVFEILLVTCIIQLSDWGFGICYIQIRSIIRSYLEKTGQASLFPDGLVGRKWFRNFLNRHENLSFRKATNLAANRAKSLTKECLDDFFALVKRKYDELGLHRRPFLIWNVDEFGFSCDQGSFKVICRKELHNPHTIQGENA